jgi:predicted amidophosphoribosyltransferase
MKTKKQSKHKPLSFFCGSCKAKLEDIEIEVCPCCGANFNEIAGYCDEKTNVYNEKNRNWMI